MDSTAVDLAGIFLRGLRDHDVDAALCVLDQDCTVSIPPAGIEGIALVEGRQFLLDTVRAFPDLMITVHRWFVAEPDSVVAEVTVEGTQAADYLGMSNQEKHIDLDQVWIVRTADGRVTHIRAMWDQTQLYRRLAVKRLDAVDIAATGKG